MIPLIYVENLDLIKNLLLRLADQEFPQPRPGTSLAKNKKDDEIKKQGQNSIDDSSSK